MLLRSPVTQTSTDIFLSLTDDYLFIERDFVSDNSQSAYIVLLFSGSFFERLKKLLSLRKKIPSVSFIFRPDFLLASNTAKKEISSHLSSKGSIMTQDLIFVNKTDTTVLSVFPKEGNMNLSLVSKDIQVNLFPKSVFRMIFFVLRKRPVPVFRVFLTDQKASDFFSVIARFPLFFSK